MKNGSFAGYFEREMRICFYQGMCKRRLRKQASLSIRAPLGNLGEGVCLLGTLRDRRRALKWSICLNGSSEKPRRGGACFTGDSEGWLRKALEMGISLHRGPIVELWEELIYQGLGEREMRRTSLFAGALWGELRGRTSLLGTLKDMLKRPLETGVCFHSDPILGNMEGMLLSQGLWEKDEFFLSGELVLGNPKDA
jgi:hypothetical protein